MIVTFNATKTFETVFLCVLLMTGPLSTSQEARRLSEYVWSASKNSSDLSRGDTWGRNLWKLREQFRRLALF